MAGSMNTSAKSAAIIAMALKMPKLFKPLCTEKINTKKPIDRIKDVNAIAWPTSRSV